MKVNRTGYWLFAGFGLGGIAFLVLGLFLSGPAGGTFLLIGAIWVLGTLGVILYAMRQGKRAEHGRWLFDHGLAGRATVVKASSGVLINDQPVMHFVLDVEIPGQAPRRIHHKILMSTFAAYRMRPGVVLPIHVNPDPRKTGDVLLRW